MRYKNPIPSLDDQYQSKKVFICFDFESPVTQEEAARGLTELIAENGGKIPKEWIKFGDNKNIRYHKGQGVE